MGACLSGRSLNGNPFSEIYDSNEMVNRRKQVLSNLKVYTLAGWQVAGLVFCCVTLISLSSLVKGLVTGALTGGGGLHFHTGSLMNFSVDE